MLVPEEEDRRVNCSRKALVTKGVGCDRGGRQEGQLTTAVRGGYKAQGPGSQLTDSTVLDPAEEGSFLIFQK